MNHDELASAIWLQFGAAIDALENAIMDCPPELWGDRTQQPEIWYMAFHTLFWLDYYLSESPQTFAPPAPFGKEEMDPAGVLPERVYMQAELLDYLQYDRQKCRELIHTMTPETASAQFVSGNKDFSRIEVLLYNLRHVQHHAAQLNLLLRQRANLGMRWTFRAANP